MKDNIKKWIWQHDEYPNFKYKKEDIKELLGSLEYNRGILDGVARLFGEDDIRDIEIDILLEEAINTSQIEGEYLKRESVRASLRKKLDETFDGVDDTSTHQTDALVDVLIDCSINREPLSQERLHGWHNCLFVTRYDRLRPIRVASFREHDDMEVISGAIGREKIHYLAPPQSNIDDDVARLLKWCRDSDENIYIKSAIAHLWFVSIHPYDDGNGRIARAITDYILSTHTSSSQRFKLYSISMAINSERKEYYDILDRTTNLFINRDFDFTPWIKWHLSILNSAMLMAHKKIEYIISKTKFWDRHRKHTLNKRQLKVINKILAIGYENFLGGLNTKKYMAITKTSKATAIRDIKELIDYECIKQIEGTAGRGVRYEIVLV